MKSKPLGVVIILMIISLMPVVYCISASTSNARIVIETEVNEGEPQEIVRTLTYNNKNDIDVIVSLSLTGDLAYIGELETEELEIEAGGSENVDLYIILDQPGLYEGNVNAIYSEVGAGSGIGISSVIIVSASGEGEMWVSPDEDVEDVEPEVAPVEEEKSTVSIGGTATKDDTKKTTTSTKSATKETKEETNTVKTDYIEKYFHGNLLAFFIVLILMMLIGLEIFYVIYRIVKR